MRRVTVLLGGLEFYDASGQAEVAALRGLVEKWGSIGRNVDLDDPLAGRSYCPGARRQRNCRRASRSCSQPSTPATATYTPACHLSSCWLPIRSAQDLCRIRDVPRHYWILTFDLLLWVKWLALFEEAAPEVSGFHFVLFETAPLLKDTCIRPKRRHKCLANSPFSAPCGNDADIQGAFAARARGDGGIIGIAYTFVADHRDLIIALATQHRTCLHRWQSDLCPVWRANGLFARRRRSPLWRCWLC